MSRSLLVATAVLAGCAHPAPQDAVDAGDRADATVEPDALVPTSPVAWYHDGLTTGTGSANDFAALGVTASTITVAQLATLIETNKYSGQPRDHATVTDFDEVFLTRATQAGFLHRLALAVTRIRADGFAKVIVYANGPRSIAEAAAGGWAGIAAAGAMVGLEAYTTTFWGDVKAAEMAHPFVDVADPAQCLVRNQALFAAFEARLATYVHDAKAQLGAGVPADHLALIEFEAMSHDIDAAVAYGFATAKATHFARLWYVALEAVAAAEGIHFGVFHPA